MSKEDQVKTTSASRALFSSSRLWLRDQLLPFVVAETPMITRMQDAYRSPGLDKVFMAVSFIGSHVFYMLFLPLLTWFGFSRLLRLLTSQLALSLYIVNIIKDSLCLPRPTSPPVVRLSSDYHMEYGFPSAHAVNALNMAISIALYFVTYGDPAPTTLQQVLAWSASLSFVAVMCFSRVYCGMHTITDIIGGLGVGATIQLVWIYYYPIFDQWMTNADIYLVFIYSIAVAVAMLWIYPDPVDPTPSFDDAISFVWVVAGMATATRAVSGSFLSNDSVYPGFLPYSFHDVGLVKSLLRLVVGVSMIVLWRMLAKKALLWLLPPIYRSFEFIPKRRATHRKSRSLGSTALLMLPSALRGAATTTSRTAAGHQRTDSNGSNSGSSKHQYAFHRIPRYDVDVVTRCIVYFGIGFLACYGCPMAFYAIGL